MDNVIFDVKSEAEVLARNLMKAMSEGQSVEEIKKIKLKAVDEVNSKYAEMLSFYKAAVYEEELMMETWHLLEKDREVLSSPLFL